MRCQHARRRIGEHIGEGRARHGDKVVAVGAAALAEEQQRVGIAGAAERDVVDEALSRLMPQIHRPLFRQRGNRPFSSTADLSRSIPVTRGRAAAMLPQQHQSEGRVADEPKDDMACRPPAAEGRSGSEQRLNARLTRQ